MLLRLVWCVIGKRECVEERVVDEGRRMNQNRVGSEKYDTVNYHIHRLVTTIGDSLA